MGSKDDDIIGSSICSDNVPLFVFLNFLYVGRVKFYHYCICNQRPELKTIFTRESQPRSKPDWISEVQWPALIKFQLSEVSASGNVK